MRAKKSLGQNFLNSHAVAREIVASAKIVPSNTVLEIGPGKGFLTEGLLASGARVIVVEKDDRMIPLLSDKFAQEILEKRLTLIHGDIVELLDTQTLKLPKKYKVVANIPYYITGYILRAFLERGEKPETMVLMVQKEVADRIIARDKKESILSIAVKAYGTPRLVKKVPARYFTPAPNVDSAVIAIEDISNKHFKNKSDEARFFEIMKTGFAHKRKQLSGNLKEIFGTRTPELLLIHNIDPYARGEDLSFEDWITLTAIKK